MSEVRLSLALLATNNVSVIPETPPGLQPSFRCVKLRAFRAGKVRKQMSDATVAENVLWAECFRNWSLTGFPVPSAILKRRCQSRFPNVDAEQVVRRVSDRMAQLAREHRAQQSWR